MKKPITKPLKGKIIRKQPKPVAQKVPESKVWKCVACKIEFKETSKHAQEHIVKWTKDKNRRYPRPAIEFKSIVNGIETDKVRRI